MTNDKQTYFSNTAKLLFIISLLFVGLSCSQMGKIYIVAKTTPVKSDAVQYAQGLIQQGLSVTVFASPGNSMYNVALGPYQDRKIAQTELLRLRNGKIIGNSNIRSIGSTYVAVYPEGAADRNPIARNPQQPATQPVTTTPNPSSGTNTTQPSSGYGTPSTTTPSTPTGTGSSTTVSNTIIIYPED